MKIKLTLVFFFFINHIFAGGEVTIKGFAPEYASYELIFNQDLDPISEEKIELCHININPDGSFSKSFLISEITIATTHFDSYVASIYLVPGETCNIILPPLKKISDSQKQNPFFKPIPIHLAIKDAPKEEINRMVREFEQAYQKTEARFFNQIYRKKSQALADSVKTILNNQFPKTKLDFFEDYKFYRLAFVEFALHQGRAENFIRHYFVDHQPNFSVAPCKNLFDRLFTNYFSQLANSINGNEFRRIVAKSDPDAIKNYLINQNNTDQNLAQLIVLQSVKDAFFQGQFSQKNLLAILDNIPSSNWNDKYKKIAERLKKKLTYMLPGAQAPILSMKDFDGNNYQLTDFADHYTYLHFTRVANPICRQHLDELKKLPQAVSRELKILNLILPGELAQKEQIKKQDWPGLFMVVDEKVVDRWHVKSFPTTYLIDKNGKLIYSPAANPLNGFDRQIGAFLQKKHIEKIRNQPK